MNNVKIQQVPTFKYLGVTLDATLTYKSHITSMVNTILHKKFVLGKVLRHLTTSAAILIFRTMIVPYFDYCDVIYQGAAKDELDLLQRLQNKCLKMCQGLGM